MSYFPAILQNIVPYRHVTSTTVHIEWIFQHFCKGLFVANIQFPNSDLRVRMRSANFQQYIIYINLRRSRDFLRSCVQSSVDSIHSVRFGQLLRCAHKRIVNIMKLHMERKNRQLELIRFRKNYRIYSRLLFRTDEVNATSVFTLG